MFEMKFSSFWKCLTTKWNSPEQPVELAQCLFLSFPIYTSSFGLHGPPVSTFMMMLLCSFEIVIMFNEITSFIFSTSFYWFIWMSDLITWLHIVLIFWNITDGFDSYWFGFKYRVSSIFFQRKSSKMYKYDTLMRIILIITSFFH